MYDQGQASDAPAKMTFYVPSGFTGLIAFPDAQEIGTVSAKAVAADQGNAEIELAGTVTAALPTDTIATAAGTVPLSALSIACTGTAAHSAYWLLNLAFAGQTLQVPVYLDDIRLDNPLTDLANDVLTICLPSPNTPVGTPGRAVLGAKLYHAEITVSAFSAPPDSYTWRVVTTPYNAGAATLNAAGVAEAQSVDRTPQALTIKGKAVKGKPKTAVISGKLTAGTAGVSGGVVSIMSGKTVLKKVTTKAGGSYSVTLKLPRKSMILKATATVATKASGGCEGPLVPTCTSHVLAGFTVKADASAHVKTN